MAEELDPAATLGLLADERRLKVVSALALELPRDPRSRNAPRSPLAPLLSR
jgi:hypothetical protein